MRKRSLIEASVQPLLALLSCHWGAVGGYLVPGLLCYGPGARSATCSLLPPPTTRDRGCTRLQQQGRGPTRGAGRAEPGPGAPGVACPPVSGHGLASAPAQRPAPRLPVGAQRLLPCRSLLCQWTCILQVWAPRGPGQHLRGASPGATPVSRTPLPADGLAPPEAWGPGSAQPDGEGPDLRIPPQGPDRVLRPSAQGEVWPLWGGTGPSPQPGSWRRSPVAAQLGEESWSRPGGWGSGSFC